MYKSLLPENVDKFLDDVESTSCLPILLIMVLCTVQFVFNHIFYIGYTVYDIIKDRWRDENNDNEKGIGIISKIKEILYNWIFGRDALTNSQSAQQSIDQGCSEIDCFQNREWDYCD